MPSKRNIEESICERFLQAVEEIRLKGAPGASNYKEIYESLDEFPQVHRQLKTGARYPTLKNIVRICEEYGYSVDWIMFGNLPRRSKSVKGKTLDERLTALKDEFITVLDQAIKKKN